MTDTTYIPNTPDLTPDLTKRFADMLAERDRIKTALEAAPKDFEDADALAAARQAVIDTNALTAKAKRTHEAEKAPHLAAGKQVDQFFNAGIRDQLVNLKTDVADRIALYLQKVQREREAAAAREAIAAREAADKLASEAQALEEKGNVREADARMTAAVEAEKDAERAETFTNRSMSDQSRVSVGGGTMSARTKPDFRNLNRAQLDLEALRPFISEEHLEAAIRRFLATGQKTLKGVEIYDKPVATIR